MRMFACGPLWEAALLVLDRGSAGDVFIVKFLDDLGEIHLVHRLVKSDENVREWHAALLVLDRASQYFVDQGANFFQSPLMRARVRASSSFRRETLRNGANSNRYGKR